MNKQKEPKVSVVDTMPERRKIVIPANVLQELEDVDVGKIVKVEDLTEDGLKSLSAKIHRMYGEKVKDGSVVSEKYVQIVTSKGVLYIKKLKKFVYKP